MLFFFLLAELAFARGERGSQSYIRIACSRTKNHATQASEIRAGFGGGSWESWMSAKACEEVFTVAGQLEEETA
jgi:hypothetical protein